ncbi:MAG: TIM barrel protein [Anaerolineales bacterium]|jgi:sugar phosphate isomerase/epimerase
MSSRIGIGVNNGFAAKNWPEPREWARIIAKELGLHYVQFSFDLLDPTLPEPNRSSLCGEIRSAINEFGLVLHSTFTGLIIYSQNHLAHPDAAVRESAYHWSEGALEVSKKLNAQAYGGHIGAMSALDYADPERRAFIHYREVEAVRSLTKLAAQLGLQYFLWEPMPTPREIPHDPHEAIELMEEVNQGSQIPVYLCFDVGHCNSFDFNQPGDPYEWLEKLLPWTRVIHLQQTDGKADHHWPFTPEFNKIGIIDPKRIAEIAKESPFPEIPLFFELGHAFDATDQHILEDHKQSIEFWSKYL